MGTCNYQLNKSEIPNSVRPDFAGFDCERDVWRNGLCIWHANERNKPVDKMESELEKSGKRLIGAKIHNVHFGSSVSLDGCDLLNATITYCNFEEMNLKETNLINARIEKCDFTRANLQYAGFQYATLSDVKLIDSDLYKAVFQISNLETVYFRKANIEKTKFHSVDLSGKHFAGYELIEVHFEGSNLSNCDFKGVTLTDAVLTGTDLTNSDFGGGSLCGVEFTGATIQDTHFGGANLSGADFYNMDLTSAGLGGTNLENVNFESADISGLDLSGLDLSNSNLSGATLTNTNLRNADLSDANLEGAILEETDIRGANLTQSKTYQTYFHNTRIDRETEFGETCYYHNSSSDDLEKAIRVYRDYEQALRENSLPEKVRKVRINGKDARRDLNRYRSIIKWIISQTSNIIWKYGESWRRILSTSISVIIIFSVIYLKTGIVETSQVPSSYEVFGHQIIISEEIFNIATSIYFSIVTFTTLGYGDVEPSTVLTRVLAGGEAMLGGLLMAALVFVLGRRATW